MLSEQQECLSADTIAIHYMTGESVYDISGDHPVKQFVEIADGEPMNGAGPHFTIVCRDGMPIPVPSSSSRAG